MVERVLERLGAVGIREELAHQRVEPEGGPNLLHEPSSNWLRRWPSWITVEAVRRLGSYLAAALHFIFGPVKGAPSSEAAMRAARVSLLPVERTPSDLTKSVNSSFR